MALSDVGCKTVANMIKGKSPEEIRNMFNITKDFTDEEEVKRYLVSPMSTNNLTLISSVQEQIRRENVRTFCPDSFACTQTYQLVSRFDRNGLRTVKRPALYGISCCGVVV